MPFRSFFDESALILFNTQYDKPLRAPEDRNIGVIGGKSELVHQFNK